jgi:hypothetical protein
MGFIKVRGIDFYYEEKGEGLPILLILRPAAPPRRGGPFSAIWPAWAESSRMTGVGTAVRGVRLSARPQSIRRMPQQSWKHWRLARQWRSGRALGRLSHYVWRSVDPISSARPSYTRHRGVRCGTPARRPSARWRGWNGRHGEAATPRQPKRFSASSTPIAMAEARGTNSPKNGDGPPRKTGNQSSLIWKAPSSATPAPRTWRRSPHRSCARMAREARATCAPSRARWPGPSRRLRYGRSTALLTPSRSTRRANSSTSSAKRFVHRSLVPDSEVPTT